MMSCSLFSQFLYKAKMETIQRAHHGGCTYSRAIKEAIDHYILSWLKSCGRASFLVVSLTPSLHAWANMFDNV